MKGRERDVYKVIEVSKKKVFKEEEKKKGCQGVLLRKEKD